MTCSCGRPAVVLFAGRGWCGIHARDLGPVPAIIFLLTMSAYERGERALAELTMHVAAESVRATEEREMMFS